MDKKPSILTSLNGNRQSQIIKKRRIGKFMNKSIEYDEKEILRKLTIEIKKDNDLMKHIKDFDIGKLQRVNYMYSLLICINGFNDFQTRHNLFIEKATIKKSLELSNYLYLSKSNVVFDKNDDGLYFYGLLSGSISLYDKDKLYKLIPTGTFFGDWEIISNNKHKYKAICNDDCQFLILSSNDFTACFKKLILKCHHEYKKTLIEKEKCYYRYLSKSSESFYYTCRVRSYLFDEYVYKENDVADKFYFLLKGSFYTEKIYKHTSKSSIQDNDLLRLNSLNLLILDKNEFAGIECLNSMDLSTKYRNKKDKYFTSLICKTNHGVVLEFDPENLDKYVYFDFIPIIKPQISKRIEIIKKRLSSYLTSQISINYDNKISLDLNRHTVASDHEIGIIDKALSQSYNLIKQEEKTTIPNFKLTFSHNFNSITENNEISHRVNKSLNFTLIQSKDASIRKNSTINTDIVNFKNFQKSLILKSKIKKKNENKKETKTFKLSSNYLKNTLQDNIKTWKSSNENGYSSGKFNLPLFSLNN